MTYTETMLPPADMEDPWIARHAPERLRRDRFLTPAPSRDRDRRDRGIGGMPAGAVLGVGLALAAGGALAAVALRQRGDDERPNDDAPDRAARGSAQRGRRAVVGRTVTINRPRSELYAHWRDFQNLARFMESVESVRVEGRDRHVWSFEAPGGTATVRTRITEERENEVIAWESVEGSDVELAERVTFSDAPGGRGTRVEAEIHYRLPLGEVGRLLAKLFQREPRVQARRDLKRFKMLMETGEIATAQNRRAA